MCLILFLPYVLTNIDHGAIPSGIKEMQEELQLPTVAMGNFGSLVFFGVSCGSLCATLIVGKIDWKTIL